MPPRDTSLRLQDIIEAIARIRRYTATHTLESFAADDMAVDAVVRNLEVIGEAARQVDDATIQRLAGVPWREMRDLRNLLVHEYFGVSVPIIWRPSSATCLQYLRRSRLTWSVEMVPIARHVNPSALDAAV